MVRKIVWSDTALENLDKINEYLKLNWGNKVIENFHRQLYSKISLLLVHPQLGGKTSKHSRYRNYLITKSYQIIYLHNEEEIVIVRIKHTRQNK